MTDNETTTTEAPEISGNYKKVTTSDEPVQISTNVVVADIRTVTTTATQGKVVLRYTPRETNDAQETN